MISSDNAAGSAASENERRARHDLRDKFDQAYKIAFPLLDPKQNLQGSSSSHFLRVVLHDAFPDLHQQDVAILAVSVERVFRQRSQSEGK